LQRFLPDEFAGRVREIEPAMPARLAERLIDQRAAGTAK
jgi:hypothetical protein